ncbi:MAG: hypothetical protein JRH01_12150, partial [Deltaproteobacteria bacterium]|nr:hypothetical protein [Deltaproteobacteria bacterium]
MPRRQLSQHNLTKRKGTWYFQVVRGGRRVRFSLETGDLEEACTLRDEALAELEHPTPGVTLAQFAPVYLGAVKGKLKQSTYAAHRALLRPPDPKQPGDKGGLLYRELGHLRLDKIDQQALKAFWRDAVVKPGLKHRTGLTYLGV